MESWLIRTHIVLVDKKSKFDNKLKGKTDTFKDVVIDFDGDDYTQFLGKFVVSKIYNGTSKTLFGTFEEETNIKNFSEKSNGKAFY